MRSKTLTILATSIAALIQANLFAADGLRPVNRFDAVENQTSLNVVLNAGPRTSVKVEGSSADVKQVVTRVRNGRLTISLMPNSSIRKRVTVRITTPSLKAYGASGSGNNQLSNLHGNSLSLSLSGSGNIMVSGSETSLAISVGGSGNITAVALAAKSAAVAVSGSGSVRVGNTKSLTANISGSGRVTYSGNPHVVKQINGSGQVVHA